MTGQKAEVAQFVEFAVRHLESQQADRSPEELLDEWRAETELRETTADIEQGMADYAAGLAEPIEVAFADLRRRLNALSP